MAEWVLGSELNPMFQREALAKFVYRNTVENRKRHPQLYSPGGPMASCTLPPITDQEWLACTKFAMRTWRHNWGYTGFDQRIKRCETN